MLYLPARFVKVACRRRPDSALAWYRVHGQDPQLLAIMDNITAARPCTGGEGAEDYSIATCCTEAFSYTFLLGE
jgi:hypothetical protein